MMASPMSAVDHSRAELVLLGSGESLGAVEAPHVQELLARQGVGKPTNTQGTTRGTTTRLGEHPAGENGPADTKRADGGSH